MIRWAALLHRAFVGGTVAWAAALPLATFAASRPQASAVGYLFALGAYLIGGVLCHQLDERSFHWWGRQLPVCARCTGIYAGAAIAALVLAVRRPGSARTTAREAGDDARAVARWSWRTILIAAALPAALTLIFEWTTGITPGNVLRAATGVVLGAAVAALIVYEVN